MLREYKTVQQTKLACQMEAKGQIEKVKEGVAKYTNKVGAIIELMEFTYTKDQGKPEPGDYIVQVSDSERYLVKKDAFEKEYRPAGFKLR